MCRIKKIEKKLNVRLWKDKKEDFEAKKGSK